MTHHPTYYEDASSQFLALRRQIDATDRQIDMLVYELYGLGEEEIVVVEISQ